MGELAQCTRCRNVIIDEEYYTHQCRPKSRGHKIIKYSDYLLLKNNPKSREAYAILVVGLDGITYDFVHVPENKEHTKIPYQPTFDSDKNNRRLDRTNYKY